MPNFPPSLPPTSCYLLCKIKRNIASKLSLIRGLCFQIQEYEKEIRQLRTDYANSSYEVGICQSGHTSTNQIYPTSETLATIVTTFGCSVSYDWLLVFMATINQSYPNYPRNRCAESLYSYQCWQTLFLSFKFVTSETKETFVSRTGELLIGTLMSVYDVSLTIAMVHSGMKNS